MIDFVEDIELVNAVTDGMPFVCPVCHKEKENWDYVRIHFRGVPNPHSVHIKCLLVAVGAKWVIDTLIPREDKTCKEK